MSTSGRVAYFDNYRKKLKALMRLKKKAAEES
jgi:hypothetical protein